MKKILEFLKKFKIQIAIAVGFLLSIFIKSKAPSVKDAKKEVKDAKKDLSKSKEKLNKKEDKFIDVINNTEKNTTKIKKDKKERDEEAKKFFPDV